MQVRRDWQEIFKVMKSKNLKPRLLYPAKLSFRLKDRKRASDNKKLKEFIITKPVLYEMLKGLLEEGGGGEEKGEEEEEQQQQQKYE